LESFLQKTNILHLLVTLTRVFHGELFLFI
jgi:hypothetical protein